MESSASSVDNISILYLLHTQRFIAQYVYFSLLGIQNVFDVEWRESRLTKGGWATNASKEAILGYKLIVLSCDPSNPRNVSRVSPL